jgi:hypothetical protein
VKPSFQQERVQPQKIIRKNHLPSLTVSVMAQNTWPYILLLKQLTYHTFSFGFAEKERDFLSNQKHYQVEE